MATTNPPPLVEGEDYTIENGRWVFSQAYLTKRGTCCGSGCRHCPYDQHAASNKVPAAGPEATRK